MDKRLYEKYIVVFMTLFGRIGLGKLDKERGVIEGCVLIDPIATDRGIQLNIRPFFEPFSSECPSIEIHKLLTYSRVKPDFEKAYIEVTTNLRIASSEDEVEKLANDIMKFRGNNSKLK